MQSKVTIVTITYNLIKAGREKTFRQCVESVHNQTYKNIEHIIIDGASDDGTLDLIKEYSDKGWVICYSEPDNGIYDAMNKGIVKATGEYINFLNSDDYYCDRYAVEESIHQLQINSGDIIASNHNIIDANNSIIKENVQIGWSKMFIGEFPCHQTVFYKLNMLKQIGGYNTDYIDADNISFLTFKFKNAKFLYNKISIVNFRAGGLSVSLDRIKAFEDFTKTFNMFFNQKNIFTDNDIKNYYGKQFLKLPIDDAIELGAKLYAFNDPDWISEYFKILFDNYNQKNKKNSSFLQKIFSIINEYSGNKRHKVITILGIKIKIKRKKK